MEEMVFWSEKEECNNSNICENFIEDILEYILDSYVLDVDLEELYDNSLERSEIVDDLSFSNIYYDFKYEYII